MPGSNGRPAVYETAALPTELTERGSATLDISSSAFLAVLAEQPFVLSHEIAGLPPAAKKGDSQAIRFD